MNETRSQEFLDAQAAALAGSGVAAKDVFVEVASLRGPAHVLVAGEGPPVVMLNGIGTPAAMWAPLMGHLRGFRLHAIDLPGFGLTAPPRERPGDIRAHAVDFLEQTLDGLSLKCPAFTANSLGSLWAIWAAVDRPERVGPMAHVGCPALAPGTSAPLPMRLLSARAPAAILTRIEHPSPGQVRRLSKLVNQHPLKAEIAGAILATERMPAFDQCFRWTLAELLRIRGARPARALTEAQLSAITQRSLLIFGRQDPMGSENAGRRMAKAIRSAELHICEGGHCPWLNEPGLIAQWIKAFLERDALPG